jgi:hypothetical protein
MRTARWAEAFSPGSMLLSRRRRSLSSPEGMGPCVSVFGTKFLLNFDDIKIFWARKRSVLMP